MDIRSRTILFLCLCIPVRVFLVYLTKAVATTHWIAVIGGCAALISLGLMYQYIFNPHKPGAFGGDSWWNGFRPVHSALYMAVAVLALSSPMYAYIPLAIDILFGFAVFMMHYI